MEERKVTRFYCVCGRDFKSRSGCKGHEKICWFVKENEACPTCRFARRRYESYLSETTDSEGTPYTVEGTVNAGYICLHESFEKHKAPHMYAKEYNISVGCEMHEPTAEIEEE
jgi:hypothetical protein